MIPWTVIAIYFLCSAILGLVIGSDAQRKGLKQEDVYGWTALTFIFSLLALLLYLVVIVPKPMIQASCPRCSKPIQPDWRICPYCSYRFDASKQEA